MNTYLLKVRGWQVWAEYCKYNSKGDGCSLSLFRAYIFWGNWQMGIKLQTSVINDMDGHVDAMGAYSSGAY